MQSAEDAHMILDYMGGAILSVCKTVADCHKDAKYWMPQANMLRLDVFMKMSKIPQVTTQEQFAKLLAGRIVVEI